MRMNLSKVAECHTDRPHMAHGLCNKCYLKNYRLHNKARIRARQRVWDLTEHAKEQHRRWRKTAAGRQYHKSYLAMKRAHMKLALPGWADLSEIRQIYNNCPEGMEVDHIVPLKGKNVCGLHVAWNLQYLPTAENRRKGNRYEPS